MAALNPGSEFVGVDFYPEHIAHGRTLAAKQILLMLVLSRPILWIYL